MASRSSNPLWYSIRRASAHIIVLSSYSPFVKYTPQWRWLREELTRVDREKTPWLIVLMHAPIYNSNEAHFMEGEAMRAVFESWFIHYKVDLIFAGHVHAYERSYRISNIQYNVSSGDRYPIPDISAPIYITVGDGGNQEGLAASFRDPQPDYSAFREASYGHSTLEIKNRTHAFYHWNRNDDGKKVATDTGVFHNQYWASNLQRRRLKKNHLRNPDSGVASSSIASY
ncbi:bifunctional purple acid phosphatase 26-like isoform X1 [Macadamia integrifolia]|uniref:bifunctional purple acid phosphatase 26-like isoform X1 n=1 Tax=Macadamia integrifolia TaxID=60698 RepID=UPI001C4EEFA8|nr:bifunctional purple acid phosphatase 26-like isoform X1 [Macadamia integrifolia]